MYKQKYRNPVRGYDNYLTVKILQVTSQIWSYVSLVLRKRTVITIHNSEN